MTDISDLNAPPVPDTGQTALFLDFDGTLVDIAPRPDAVRVDPGLGPLLDRLHAAAGGAVALVSGRSVAELRQFLPGFPGLMIGSHGAELPAEISGAPAHDETADRIDLAALHARVRAFAAEHDLLAEPKPHGAAIHFRARPEAEPLARAFAEALAAEIPALALQPAKMAYELRPRGASKDRALRRIAVEAPFAGRLPVYLGDDTTDEPALDWARQSGGVAVKIGAGDSLAPYRLPDPAAVHGWLRQILATSEGK